MRHIAGTPTNIALAANALLRGGTKKVVIFVEGTRDNLLLARLVDMSKVAILAANGRDRAIEAVSKLKSFSTAICVVDRDFYEFLGTLEDDPKIKFYDYRDLGQMIINSRAIETVIESRFYRNNPEIVKSIRSLIAHANEIAAPLSVIRIISQMEAIPLDFKHVDYGALLKIKTISVDTVINVVMQCNSDKRHLKQFIIDRAKTVNIRDIDNSEWCHGHDVFGILGVLICQKVGRNIVIGSELERETMSAYSILEFYRTKLFGELEKVAKIADIEIAHQL